MTLRVPLPRFIRDRLPKGSSYKVTDAGHMIDIPGHIHPRVLKGDISPIAGVRELMGRYILEKTKYEPHEFEINPLDYVTELIVNAIVHGNRLKKRPRPVRIFFRYLEAITPTGFTPTFEVRVRDMGAGISSLKLAELERRVQAVKSENINTDALSSEKTGLEERLARIKADEARKEERRELEARIKAIDDELFERLTSLYGPSTAEDVADQKAHDTTAGTKGGLLLIKQVANVWFQRLPEEPLKKKNDYTSEVVAHFPLIPSAEASEYQEGQERRLAPIKARWEEAQREKAAADPSRWLNRLRRLFRF